MFRALQIRHAIGKVSDSKSRTASKWKAIETLLRLKAREAIPALATELLSLPGATPLSRTDSPLAEFKPLPLASELVSALCSLGETAEFEDDPTVQAVLLDALENSPARSTKQANAAHFLARAHQNSAQVLALLQRPSCCEAGAYVIREWTERQPLQNLDDLIACFQGPENPYVHDSLLRALYRELVRRGAQGATYPANIGAVIEYVRSSRLRSRFLAYAIPVGFLPAPGCREEALQVLDPEQLRQERRDAEGYLKIPEDGEVPRTTYGSPPERPDAETRLALVAANKLVELQEARAIPALARRICKYNLNCMNLWPGHPGYTYSHEKAAVIREFVSGLSYLIDKKAAALDSVDLAMLAELKDLAFLVEAGHGHTWEKCSFESIRQTANRMLTERTCKFGGDCKLQSGLLPFGE